MQARINELEKMLSKKDSKLIQDKKLFDSKILEITTKCQVLEKESQDLKIANKNVQRQNEMKDLELSQYKQEIVDLSSQIETIKEQ